MIERLAADLIGQMTETKLIDKNMEERYKYVFTCWVEKFIAVGSIVLISLIINNLLPTIFFLVFFLELRKRTGGIPDDSMLYYFGSDPIAFFGAESAYLCSYFV